MPIKKKKHILLTNDDGIGSPGIRKLAEALCGIFHVHIVAPMDEKSACSRGMTLNSPLHADSKDLGIPHASCHGVGGLPVDCVKLGIDSLIRDPIDLVISGINRGINTGIDVHYSGTVGAAMEAYMMGYNALAFSLDTEDRKADYSVAVDWCLRMLDIIREWKVERYIYNINIPYCPDQKIKGVRLTRLNNFTYRENYESGIDKSGRKIFNLKGERVKLDPDPNSDIIAVMAGYVALTPLTWDFTDYRMIEKLSSNFKE
ncbi:MAG: 5'/3'-nucleotidase SurE [Candidatus Wallbacteria bacterium]|nr:5'/3'-nucleotidase SurE [Candidatus Wallbacteria bacterium]